MRHHAFLIRWTRLTWGILVSACALAALGTSVAQASPPCHVPSTAYPTIQSAINDDTCDTINVAAGTYTENVFIRRSVTIRGADEATTIVDGGGNGTVFEIFATGGVTIKNVTIRNGASGGTGGGIDMCCTASLTLQNSTVSDNSAGTTGGGIVAIAGIEVSLTRTEVVNNTPNN
jgi:nitrous oxidase accessory protein NosD